MGRYAPTLAAELADTAGVTSGMRVVDVGCRPGGLTQELVARVGAANVAAIDPAPQFVAACHDRNPGADVREGVAEELPWANGSFEATLSSLVLGFMRDPDRGVSEMVRVTWPGGTVAACMWDTATGAMTMAPTSTRTSPDPISGVATSFTSTSPGPLNSAASIHLQSGCSALAAGRRADEAPVRHLHGPKQRSRPTVTISAPRSSLPVRVRSSAD